MRSAERTKAPRRRSAPTWNTWSTRVLLATITPFGVWPRAWCAARLGLKSPDTRGPFLPKRRTAMDLNLTLRDRWRAAENITRIAALPGFGNGWPARLHLEELPARP